ncbi:MAG: hypothetical protein ACTHOP_12605 [Mesorhizobium sp.]
MRRTISALCFLAAATMPASALMVGYNYEDGSDSIFQMDGNLREVFEYAMADEFEFIAKQKGLGFQEFDAEIADFKGLVHPKFPNGETDKGYICGWVKGFKDITGREFAPFYYLRNGGDFHANIMLSDDRTDYNMKGFERTGCAAALGL